MNSKFSKTICVLCLCVFLSACTSLSLESPSPSATLTPTPTYKELPGGDKGLDPFGGSTSDKTVSFKDILAVKDAQVAYLQQEWELQNTIHQKLASYWDDVDRLQMIFDSSNSLFNAVRSSNANFPIVIDSGNALKQRIMKSVDFRNPLLGVKKNEMILWAGVELDPQDQTLARVVITIYQQPITQEEIKPITRKYLQMEKKKGQWQMTNLIETSPSLVAPTPATLGEDLFLDNDKRSARIEQVKKDMYQYLVPQMELQGLTDAEKTVYTKKEAQIEKLIYDIATLKVSDKELSQFSTIPRKLDMLYQSTNLLSEAVRMLNPRLPILSENDDPLKQSILSSVDFGSPLLEIKENEIIVGAWIQDVKEGQTEATVEMSVFQQAVTQEEIRPLAGKMLDMQKINDKWVMVRSR